MKNVDVSFKQRRRARKQVSRVPGIQTGLVCSSTCRQNPHCAQVESDDAEDEIDFVIVPSASSNPLAAVDGNCTPSSPAPTKASRKAAVRWRSAAAQKEVDALIKYYEEVDF